MTYLTIFANAPDIAEGLRRLQDPETPRDDKAALWAVFHQFQLRVNRVLRAEKDGLIVSMERDGLKELGPLSITSSAIEPRYVCNDADNHGDAGVQDALTALHRDPATRPYVRVIPAHLEIDPLALAADVQLGVQVALDLYRELNRRRWRVEQGRRLSLTVREARMPREEAA